MTRIKREKKKIISNETIKWLEELQKAKIEIRRTPARNFNK
ncbi:MAG: hypothetical protein N2645_03060 [Clostridia bacterium]|nr:hypothetical protein [Clostridia bacterium]